MADENRPRVKRVPPKIAEPVALPALDDSPEGKTPKLGRPFVFIRQSRTRLLDPDNLYGSVKSLLDGLQEAGLIAGDSSAQIDLEVDQIKVPHRFQEGTLIEIIY